jgi:hypothetical protein
LVIIGAFALFAMQARMLPLMGSHSVGFLDYTGAAIAVVIVLAGLLMMFVQLRGDATAPIGTVADNIRRADPEHIVVQLGKNYDLLRRQTTQGFILAGLFMGLGVLVILSGSVGKLFGLTDSKSDLVSVAGVIMEVISGTSLLVYRINFKRLNDTSDRLDATWRILTANRLAESLPENRKSEATMKLIDALIVPTNGMSTKNTPEPVGSKRAEGSVSPRRGQEGAAVPAGEE